MHNVQCEKWNFKHVLTGNRYHRWYNQSSNDFPKHYKGTHWSFHFPLLSSPAKAAPREKNKFYW